MRIITTLILFLALAGCTNPQRSYSPEEKNKALDQMLSNSDSGGVTESALPQPLLPTCYSKPQCDAMWSEATSQIQSLSRMRLQIASDTYLQTYNPTGFGRMGAEARKIPRPDGSTVIQAKFVCDYCGDLPADALQLFTLSVREAGNGFAEPYKAPSWDAEIRKE